MTSSKKITLAMILNGETAPPYAVDDFRDFVAKEHSSENLDFWESVMQYRRAAEEVFPTLQSSKRESVRAAEKGSLNSLELLWDHAAPHGSRELLDGGVRDDHDETASQNTEATPLPDTPEMKGKLAALKDELDAIITKFLTENANCEINIPEKIKKKLLIEINERKNYHPDVFRSALENVYGMNHSSHCKFRHLFLYMAKIPSLGQFRYWIKNVRHDRDDSTADKPCRFRLRIDGFELFAYNRTAAYEYLRNILDQDNASISQNSVNEGHSRVAINEGNKKKGNQEKAAAERKEQMLDKLLPLEFVGTKGAIVIGNNDLPTLLILHYKEMTGILGTVDSPSKLDYRRQFVRTSLEDYQLSFRANGDYREPSLNQAARMRTQAPPKKTFLSRRRSPDIEMENTAGFEWAGLARYKVEDDTVFRRKPFLSEYAKVEQVADGKYLKVFYYSDDAGPVVDEVESETTTPESGVELKFIKSSIHYGPWAERQSYRHSHPSPIAQIGEMRVHEEFRLQLVLDKDSTCRLPTREDSKDWKFFDDRVAENETDLRGTGYTTRTRSNGFKSRLSCFLNGLTVTSSINYSELLVSESLKVEVDMPTPLKWNGEHLWRIAVSGKSSKIYLLRDHITLVQDLLKDFSAGRPTDSLYFIPTRYTVDINLENAEVVLCTNECNVIYQANDNNDNSLQIVKVSRLQSQLVIPFLLAEPTTYRIRFSAEAENVTAMTSFPQSHTIGAFASTEAKDLAYLGEVSLSGMYEYHRQIDPSFLDVLTIDIEGSNLALKFPGFLLKVFIGFAGNYFGESMNCISAEEYRTQLLDPERRKRLARKKLTYRGDENDFELRLGAKASNAVVILPKNLYSSSTVSLCKLQNASFFTKVTSIDNDLTLKIGPLLWKGMCEFKGDFAGLLQQEYRKCEDSISVESFQMDGKRLFGPKPDYNCYLANWTLNVGAVDADVTPLALSDLITSLNSFIFHLSDVEDIVHVQPVLPEMDILEVKVKSLKCLIRGFDTLCIIGFDRGLKLHFDTFAQKKWTSHVMLDIPVFSVQGLLRKQSKNSHQSSDSQNLEWVEILNIKSGLCLDLFSKPKMIEKTYLEQQKYLKDEDVLRRVSHLYQGRSAVDGLDMELLAKGLSRTGSARPSNRSERFSEAYRSLGTHLRSQTFSGRSSQNEPPFKNTRSEGTTPITPRKKYRYPAQSASAGHLRQGNSYLAYLPQFMFKEQLDSTTHVDPQMSQTPKLVPTNKSMFSARLVSVASKSGDGLIEPSWQTEQRSASHVSVKFSEAVRILATPLVVKLVEDFVLSVKSELSLETLLDELQIDFISKALAALKQEERLASLSFSIPSFEVKTIQEMVLPVPISFLAESEIGSRRGNSTSDNVFCSLSVIGTDLRGNVCYGTKLLNGLQTGDPLPSDMSFSCSLGLLHIFSRYFDYNNAADLIGIPTSLQKFMEMKELRGVGSEVPVILELTFEKILSSGFVDWCAQKAQVGRLPIFDFACGDIATVTINQSAEILFGGFVAWQRQLSHIITIFESLQTERNQRLQSLVHVLSHAAKTTPNVGDPHFLASPSIVWSLGSHRKHQNTASWKVLAYLRHCYARIGEESLVNSPSLGEAWRESNSIVQSTIRNLGGWRSWEITDVSKTPLMQCIFQTELNSSPTIVGTASSSWDVLSALRVGLAVKKLDMTVFEQGSENNILTISPIVAKVHCAQRDQPGEISKSKQPRSKSSRQYLLQDESAAAKDIFVDVFATVTGQHVFVYLNPNIFRLIQHVSRVYRWFEPVFSSPSLKPSKPSASSSRTVKHQYIFGGSLSLNSLLISASAHNLDMEIKISNFISSFVQWNVEQMLDPKVKQAVRNLKPTSTCTISLDSLYLIVSERLFSATSTHEAKKLLIMQILKVVSSVTTACSSFNGSDVDKNASEMFATVAIKNWNINLPESLLKLQAFVERWGDEDYPNYDFLIKRLINEWAPEDAKESTKNEVVKSNPSVAKLSVDFTLDSLTILSELIASLKAAYHCKNMIIMVQQRNTSEIGSLLTESNTEFMGRIESHNVYFANIDTELPLPAVSVDGTQKQSTPIQEGRILHAPLQMMDSAVKKVDVKCALRLAVIEGHFSPDLVDRLIRTQSVIVSELNDVIDLGMFYVRKQSVAEERPKRGPRAEFNYQFRFSVGGIDIRAVGPFADLKFNSGQFSGCLSSTSDSSDDLKREHSWNVAANGLSISFVDNVRTAEKTRDVPAALAYIIIDFVIKNQVNRDEFDYNPTLSLEALNVKLTKIHAVVHPMAIGKVIDTILFFSQKIKKANLTKATEMSAIKLNTESFLSSFNAKVKHTESSSFFDNKLLFVQIDHFGVSIPLYVDDPSLGPTDRMVATDLSPAFLLSLRQIKFYSERFVRNEGKVGEICLQFVPEFDPTNDQSFYVSSYRSHNRVMLEGISGVVIQTVKDGGGILQINASIKGFLLEVDPKLADYVNLLIIIFARGRERVISVMPTTAPERDGFYGQEPSNDGNNKVALDVSCQFEFYSGRLKVAAPRPRKASVIANSPSVARFAHYRQTSNSTAQDLEVDCYNDQIFNLPGVSLSIEGNVLLGSGSQNASDAGEHHLRISQTIHSSENLIHPSILLFFSDVLPKINVNQSTKSELEPKTDQTAIQSPSISAFSFERLHLTYLLRLRQTKINLSCQPVAKVIFNYYVEQADLLVAFQPRQAKNVDEGKMAVTLNFTNLSSSLRHVFSPEDCLKADIPQLTLNTSMQDSKNGRKTTFEVHLPDINLNLNIRHLQDFFLFQRLWTMKPSTPPTVEVSASATAAFSDSTFGSLLSAFFRMPLSHKPIEEVSFSDSIHSVIHMSKLNVVTDLSQAIGKSVLNLEEFFATFDLSWNANVFTHRAALFSISSITVKSDGRVSGDANVSSLVLWVIGNNPSLNLGTPDILVSKVHASTGKIKAQVQYQYERIMIFECSPTTGKLLDRAAHGEISTDFKVIIDQVKVIISRRTMPTFLQLVSKVSEIITEKRLLDLPTSPLGSPIVTRRRLEDPPIGEPHRREALPFLNIITSNRMKLDVQINSTQVIFMRYNFRDPDCAQILSKQIRLFLEVEPSKQSLVETSIIDLGGFTIKKSTTKTITPVEERMWVPEEWFSFMTSSPCKNVVTVPASNLALTTESVDKVVEYSFKSDFDGQIDVALNFGLYKYLQDLAQLYQTAFSPANEPADAEGTKSVSPVSNVSFATATDAGVATAEKVDKKATNSVGGASTTLLSPASKEFQEAPSTPVDAPVRFVRKGEMKFDPQLKVTGEATPWELVEWLGVNKERIPEGIYLYLTSSLRKYRNRIVEETFRERFNSEPDKLLLTVSDFDGVTYSITTPESKTVLIFSMSMKCYPELRAYGADQVLAREYGSLLMRTPEPGFEVSLRIDLEALPADKGMNALAAPFEAAFAAQAEGRPSELMTVHYRDEEAIYIQAQPDRVTVIFSTVFKEETDQILGRVFLQEFVDARRQPAIQNAPQVLYSAREPPLELRHVRGLVDSESVGYVTFVLFPRHFVAGATREETISRIQLFRDYLHYHIKASKSYMHSRMRARVESFLKVLNRAKPEKPDDQKEKKTASGKTFKRS
ncbi:hypothetical protein HDU76_001382 [Blyttiomyces sp. JEL0837]|nr:hypothetical protein HDU76_001382 [Blyttiomyces sp. JEL0837]